ncbi:hypothetical protein OUZ56_003158 [Daphnia magna]|uniref:SWIM-type domain-containing protein n=1 Tax=Daphnia magna TaxID=35525 RepID=A0ABR0A863_9CRUS|nr:hypothetical protein OUZ56_003158 [Daphnia magna]
MPEFSSFSKNLDSEAKCRLLEQLSLLQIDDPNWIDNDLWKKNRDVLIVTASQTLSVTYYPWVACAKDGMVQFASCTCTEGVGEMCTHVATLLHTFISAHEVNTDKQCNKSCTEQKCGWIENTSKPVEEKLAIGILTAFLYFIYLEEPMLFSCGCTTGPEIPCQDGNLKPPYKRKRPVKEFYSLPVIKDPTAVGIKSTVLQESQKNRISVLKIVGFGSDNASVMTGRNKWLATLLK